MAYQSLYRRYRSQRFSDLRGQSHVTSALKAAVQNGSYGHAYLFSGPRGTGKTSTARILAKALNCDNVADGEPCGECDSCIAIEQGKSFDLHELDAASHNKVDDIRDLIAKVHLGSPGRTKVYILDEVHMLSSGAENALLKTLEEPPPHVVFVLATTEPHKVVATIRSRTQHFQFSLLPADELAEHVRYVIEDAGLDVDDDGIEYALRQGGGSARDTLSALDLVAAAGGVPAGSDVGTRLTEAIGDNNAETAIAVIQDGLVNGQEPRVIGEATVEVMRNAFLASMGARLDHLHDSAQKTSTDLAAALGPAALTRGMEVLGQCLVDMRQAPDPRVPLEVAVLRLCRSGTAPASAPAAGATAVAAAPADTAALAALQARVDDLERTVIELQAALAAGGSGPSAANRTPSTQARTTQASASRSPAPAPATSEPSGPAHGARARLAEVTGATPPPSPRDRQRKRQAGSAAPEQHTSADAPRRSQPEASADAPHRSQPSEPTDGPPPSAPEAPADASTPSAQNASATASLQTGTVIAAWSDVLDNVSKGTRVRFKGHDIVNAEGSTVTLGVPNSITADRCSERKGEVETALSDHYGHPVTLDIVVTNGANAPTDPAKVDPEPAGRAYADDDDIGPISELEDATDQSSNSIDRLTKAFPGSKVIERDPNQ